MHENSTNNDKSELDVQETWDNDASKESRITKEWVLIKTDTIDLDMVLVMMNSIMDQNRVRWIRKWTCIRTD